MGLLLHHVSLIFILLVKASQAQRGGICGKPNPAFNSRFGRPDITPNIGKWPWMASLQRNGQYLCDATLVGDEFVMTDAACFDGFPQPIQVSELTATMGRLAQSSSNPNEQIRNVSVIRLSNLPDHNIALLKIPKVTVNDFVQPICVDLDNRNTFVGKRCFTTALVQRNNESTLKEFRPFLLDTCPGFVALRVVTPHLACWTGVHAIGAKGGGPVMCHLDESWIMMSVLTLDYVSKVQHEEPPQGDFGPAGGFRPPVPSDTVTPPGGFPFGGPPYMLLPTTSRFKSFLLSLTQTLPQAPPAPTTRPPRVVITRTTVPEPVTPAPSNANGIHLSVLPALFLIVQMLWSAMQ